MNGGVVGELADFLAEGELDVAYGAVPVLCDDNFSQAWLIIFVIVVAAEKHHHDVGIVFYGAAFAQIAHHGAVALPLFHFTGELGGTKHGNIEFPC